MATKPVCCIVGVGPGNGYAFTQQFSEKNYNVAMLARNQEYLSTLEEEIKNTKGYVFDVISDTYNIIEQIELDLGPIDTLIYNAGSKEFNNFSNTSEIEFERAWQINTYGCFRLLKNLVPLMLDRKKGNIVIIGATASLNGSEGFVSFCSSKAAQRSFAQSIAKHLGPKGIHVSYVIIDAIVDLPATRQAMPDKKNDFFIKPQDIAETVFFLTKQPKSSWTFELDLRPYIEKW